MAQAKTSVIIDGKNNTKQAFDEVNNQIESMNKKLSAAGKALKGVFTVSAIAGAIRGIANAADSYNLMNARLKLATESQEEFNTAQSELRRIAQATQAPLESLATLYQRVSRPLKEAGRSQKDILAVTEAVATSFRVSGASAQEAENGVIQFAQALGSGALRGEEFNSVAEQAPRLMQALADSLGVPVGALKDMAAQGLLTADVVTTALVQQLGVLRKEAESLPATVGGAMTALSDKWNEAIGQADTGPLIEAIEQIGETISDPQIRDNLATLATAFVRVAEATIKAGAGFVGFGQDLGYVAASLSNNVAEIDRATKEIEYLEAAANGIGLLDLYMSDEAINKSLADWKAYRQQLIEQQTGMSQEMKAIADAASAEAEAAREEDISQRNQYIAELKSQQERLVKASEKAAKDLVSAEKKATSELKKVRDERLEIEKRYQEAIAGMSAGGEASYGDAQALKVGAREALRAGDVEGAQAQAQAALKMLEELRAAGANTYGFEGFIGELRDIELAANDIEQSRAEQKITEIKQEMVSLKAAASALEEMPVSVKMDDAALAQVQSALDALSQREIIVKIGAQYDFDTPYTLQDPGPAPSGFATGGYISGPGTGTSDSIPAYLSNGEYVVRAAAVKKLGKGYLDWINRGLHVPRFADGGLVGAVSSMQPQQGRDLGRVDLNVGGESFSFLAERDQFDRVLSRTRAKFGRTHG